MKFLLVPRMFGAKCSHKLVILFALVFTSINCITGQQTGQVTDDKKNATTAPNSNNYAASVSLLTSTGTSTSGTSNTNSKPFTVSTSSNSNGGGNHQETGKFKDFNLKKYQHCTFHMTEKLLSAGSSMTGFSPLYGLTSLLRNGAKSASTSHPVPYMNPAYQSYQSKPVSAFMSLKSTNLNSSFQTTANQFNCRILHEPILQSVHDACEQLLYWKQFSGQLSGIAFLSLLVLRVSLPIST